MDDKTLSSRSTSPGLHSSGGSSDIDETKPATDGLVRTLVFTGDVDQLQRLEIYPWNFPRILMSTRDSKERSVLHIAKTIPTLNYILQQLGEDQKKKLLQSHDVDGNTPLHEAAHAGDLEYFQALERVYDHAKLSPRDHGEHFFNVGNAYDETILHCALQAGHENLVHYLLQSGKCKKYSRDSDERLPLHWACTSQAIGVDVIRHLLDDVGKNQHYYRDHLIDKFGQSPLDMAYRFARKEVVAELKSHRAYMEIEDYVDKVKPYLHYVIETESVDAFAIAQDLIAEDENKSVIRALNSQGGNALHVAVEQKSDNWVAWVLSRPKVNALKANDAGDTPLHIAVDNDSTGIIFQIHVHTKEALFEKNKEGLNPLELACKTGKLKALGELLQLPTNNNKGCNLTRLLFKHDEGGETPLEIAIENKQQEAADKIIKKIQEMFVEFENTREDDSSRLSRKKMAKLIASDHFVNTMKRYHEEVSGCGPEVLNLDKYFNYEFGLLKQDIDDMRKQLIPAPEQQNDGDSLLSRRKNYLDSLDALYVKLLDGFDDLTFDKKVERIKVVFDLQDWMCEVEAEDLDYQQKCQAVNKRMKNIEAYCKDQNLIDTLKMVLATSLGVIAGVAIGVVVITTLGSVGFAGFATSATFFSFNMISAMVLGGLFGGALGASSYFALFGMKKATNNLYQQTEIELQQYKPTS